MRRFVVFQTMSLFDGGRRGAVVFTIALAGAALAPASTSVGAQATDGTGTGGSGYDHLDGRPGVWAGYLEAPRAVATPDRSVRSPTTHWCGFWMPAFSGDFDREMARAYFGDPDRRERSVVVGQLYFLQCFRDGEDEAYFNEVRLIEPIDPIRGVITTRPAVVAHARAQLELPPPRLSTQPPPDRLVTGVETWFGGAVDAPAARSAQAGRFWATVEARPVALRIDTGDGRVVECSVVDGRATADCAHTYLDSRRAPGRDGRFTVQATATYAIWVTTDLGGPTLLETIDGPTVALPVTVRPVVAVLR
jgi:hypothetical protein